MVDDGRFGLLAERFRESVEQDLLVDGEFVKDDKHLRPPGRLQVRRIESFSMFGYNQALFYQDSVRFFDGLLGDAQLGGEFIHGGEMLARLNASFMKGPFHLCYQLFVNGLIAGCVYSEYHGWSDVDPLFELQQ